MNVHEGVSLTKAPISMGSSGCNCKGRCDVSLYVLPHHHNQEERSGGVAYDDYGEMMPNGVRR